MKSNQLTMFLVLLLFLLNNCEKVTENKLQDKDFLKNEWKVEFIINESNLFTIPSGNTFFREEAYISKCS